jgi:penicillin-binding protein 1C
MTEDRQLNNEEDTSLKRGKKLEASEGSRNLTTSKNSLKNEGNPNPDSEMGATDSPSTDEGDTAPIYLKSNASVPAPFGGEGGETPATPQSPDGPVRAGNTRSSSPIPPGGEIPRRVNQTDTDATHVSPAAFQPQLKPDKPTPKPDPTHRDAGSPQRSTPKPGSRPWIPARPQPQAHPVSPGNAPIRRPSVQRAAPPSRIAAPRRRGFNWGGTFGCLLRTSFIVLFGVALTAICILSGMFYEYYRIAATLPEISDLRNRASQFETTRIFDRNGDLLYEILDPTAGRRTYVRLSKISPYMVAATIATEDKGFYSHPGFDVTAIVRAFWQNYQSGETVSGASTITQQLARSLLFTPEERSEQTYQRKVREAILAAEITRRYTKDEILELYINEIYYGNLAYGVEAAAETYFGISAEKLDLAQATFLAGLPQAPAVYDIYTNREATFARHKDVLALMYQASQEQGCIYVSNAPQKVCVDAVSVVDAAKEMQGYQFNSPEIKIRYPHWVNYIRAQLEAQYDPQTIYRAGFNVFTTLDPALQDIAQTAVSQQVASMGAQNAKSGALVIIQPNSGEILAMVGSADFYNDSISGQVNMAVNPRQPGSSIKPITYLAAFEQGWTPGTLIWDVPSEFTPSGLPNDPSPPYKPVNYDGAYHGPVTVRTALANSYNIPAVKTLQFVGIYDDPSKPGEQGLVQMARRLGISTLTRPDYGLSLTLGGGEVTLLELTGAYAVIANRGVRVPLVAIEKIIDYNGEVVFENRHQAGEQIVRQEHAYLISSILSDNQARTPAFGPHSVLELPFPVAVKTGTTNDFRDNWTLGFTPDLVVGVWVGNPDYTPMRNTTGLSGAAPIWANVMQTALQKLTQDNGPAQFTRPPGVVEHVICAISGTIPSKWCPRQRGELFAIDQPPLPADQDLWQKATLDTWTGLRASPACSEFIQDRLVLNVSDPFARKWIRKDGQGQAWANQIGFDPPVLFSPTRECKASDPHAVLDFAYPRDNAVITDSLLDIYAVANATQGFDTWQLSYGFGDNPIEWDTLSQGKNGFDQPEVIYNWDLVGFPNDIVTLRLRMTGSDGAYAERKIRLFIQAPTPTPTFTPTPTETPTPTLTETLIPTETLTPSETPSPSPTFFFPPLFP